MDGLRFEASIEGMEQLARHFEERLIRAEARSSIMVAIISVIVMELRGKQLVGQNLANCIGLVEQQFKGHGVPAVDDEVDIIAGGIRHALGIPAAPTGRPAFTVIEGGS